MSYQFKVGDKGKLRRGNHYEVIGIEPRATESGQLIVLVDSDVDGDRLISTRYMDGRYSKTRSNFDLMPPPKTVWDVSISPLTPLPTGPITSVHTYDNEEKARTMFNIYNDSKHYKNVSIEAREVQSE